MKRIVAAFYLQVFLSTIATANLLTNGDFDDPTEGLGWSKWGDSGFVSWAAQSGAYGFVLYGWMTNGCGGLSQEVAVASHSAGDVYTFQLDGMSDGGFASSSARVELQLEFLSGTTLVYEVTNNIYSDLTSSSNLWNTYALVWTNHNTSVDIVRVVLTADSFTANPGGYVLWDNASLDAFDLSVPALSLFGNESLYIGASNVWVVTRNGSTDSALTVQLTNNNPSVVTVCTGVVIEAGSTAAVFCVSGVITGVAVIGVAAEGYQGSEKFASVSEQRLVISSNSPVYAGYSNLWSLIREGPSDVAMEIDLANSAPLVLSVPPSVTMGAGTTSATFYVCGRTDGTAVVTASAIGYEQGICTATVHLAALSISGVGSVGQGCSNLWTITREGPITGPLEVTLGCNPSDIASTPGSVTIPSGTNEVSLFVSGSNVGIVTVMASATGYSTAQKILTVQANQLSLAGPTMVQLGMTNVWIVSRTGPTTTELVVSLTVDDSEVLSVPSSVVIEAGLTSATFSVVGLVLWDASLTASATDFISVSRSLDVSGNLLEDPGFEIDQWFGNSWYSWTNCSIVSWAAESGANGVVLDGWVEGEGGGFGQDVSVGTLGARGIYTFQLDGMAESGFGSSSATAELRMEFCQGELVKCVVTNNVYAELTALPGSWHTYKLMWTNDDASVDLVRVLFVANDFAPSGTYCAAMWDNASLELSSAGTSNLFLEGDTTLYRGGSNLWTVRRMGSDELPLTISLESTNTQAATVPASVTIAADADSGTFYVVSGASGTSVIKASAEGYRKVRERVTVTPASLELSGLANAYIGFSNVWTITRHGSLAGTVSVLLSSSASDVALVPASVEIPDGLESADFLVQGASLGNATITASLTGFVMTTRSVSVSAAQLTLAGEPSVYQGLSNAWSITRVGPLEMPATVFLSNNTPAILAIPASVEMPAGVGTVQFFVEGTREGTDTVFASIADYPSANRTMIVKQNKLQLSGFLTISRNGSNLWSVVRTGPLDNPLNVALESDAPSVVTVADSVNISAGTNAASFYVFGTGLGTTTVRAASTAYIASERTAAVTANLLRNPGFEEDASWGSAWNSWGDDSVETWAAESGTNGVMFYGWATNGYAGFCQTVEYSPSVNGDVFVFRLRGRTDPNFTITNGTLELRMEFLGDNGATILRSTTNNILQRFLRHKESWHGYSFVARNTNPAADHVRVMLVGTGFYTTGPLCAAMWDNVSLVSCDPQDNALLLIGDDSEYEGVSNEWIVVRLGSIDEELTVQLNSDTPSIASVTSSVVIAAGSDFAEFDVTMGGNVPLKTMRVFSGEAMISATATGYTSTNQTVSSVENILTLSGDTSVYTPGTNQWVVLRSGPLENNITVGMDSSDDSVAVVPSSVEIAAGNSSAGFSVVAAGPGVATITARASGLEPADRGITVRGLASTIDPSLESERPKLTWAGLGGFHYVIEETTRLGDSWTRCRDLYCNGDGLLFWQATDYAQATNKFYRILTVVTNSLDQPYGP